MALSSISFYYRGNKIILWSNNSILTTRLGKLLCYCNYKFIISKKVIVHVEGQKIRSSLNSLSIQYLIFFIWATQIQLHIWCQKLHFPETRPKSAVMLSNISGSLNGNSSSVNLWVFSIQQTFKMGDALTRMNKRCKQEKHVIKQCKIHNMKSQGACWSFCTPTDCRTDKTETEN